MCYNLYEALNLILYEFYIVAGYLFYLDGVYKDL